MSARQRCSPRPGQRHPAARLPPPACRGGVLSGQTYRSMPYTRWLPISSAISYTVALHLYVSNSYVWQIDLPHLAHTCHSSYTPYYLSCTPGHASYTPYYSSYTPYYLSYTLSPSSCTHLPSPLHGNFVAGLTHTSLGACRMGRWPTHLAPGARSLHRIPLTLPPMLHSWQVGAPNATYATTCISSGCKISARL